MKTLRAIFLAVAVLALMSAGDLVAQRRTTGGGTSSTPSGGDSRGTPSAGGTRSSGGDSRAAPSGTSGRATTDRSARDGGSSPAASTSGGRSARDGSSTAAPRADRPTSGKIAAVRRSAGSGRPSNDVVIIGRGVYLGGCWDCNYWGWYRGRYGWYHGGWWYPPRDRYYEERDRYNEEEEEGSGEAGGQGYLPYPYAEYDGTGTSFVQPRGSRRPAYGAISGVYFTDVGSTTVAGRFAVEGAFRSLRVDAEYGRYAEPLADRTDRLSTFRIGLAYQPRIGTDGYAFAGIGARSVALDDGLEAGGVEGQLGLQLLPFRPIGLNVTGRLADMRWEGQSEHFTLRELNATASLFVGRIEIQGGWHWLKLGDAPAFGGPTVGTRLWF